MSSAQFVLNGLNPGPMMELNFWSSRTSDLEFIVCQVCNVAQKPNTTLCTLWLFNSSCTPVPSL